MGKNVIVDYQLFKNTLGGGGGVIQSFNNFVVNVQNVMHPVFNFSPECSIGYLTYLQQRSTEYLCVVSFWGWQHPE
jgi:hypothetical protein